MNAIAVDDVSAPALVAVLMIIALWVLALIVAKQRR